MLQNVTRRASNNFLKLEDKTRAMGLVTFRAPAVEVENNCRVFIIKLWWQNGEDPARASLGIKLQGWN